MNAGLAGLWIWSVCEITHTHRSNNEMVRSLETWCSAFDLLPRPILHEERLWLFCNTERFERDFPLRFIVWQNLSSQSTSSCRQTWMLALLSHSYFSWSHTYPSLHCLHSSQRLHEWLRQPALNCLALFQSHLIPPDPIRWGEPSGHHALWVSSTAWPPTHVSP